MTDDNSIDPADSAMAGDPGGDPVPVRPEGRLDSSGDTQADAAAEAGRDAERNPLEGIDLQRIQRDPVLLAQVTAYLQENHLHLPVLTPDHVEMVRMRKETPEMYKLYVSGIQKSIEADFIQRTYPYTEPLKNVISGRRYGLVAVLGVLALAAYALHQGSPVLAGILAALDVVGLAAVFGNPGNSTKNENKTSD